MPSGRWGCGCGRRRRAKVLTHETDTASRTQRPAHPLASAFWKLTAWPLAVVLRLATGFADWTSRVEVEGAGAGYRGPALYVHWHRYMPYLGVHHGKHRRWLMMSRDPYMASIALWNRLHGARTVRGGSGSGGQQALQQLVQRLSAGESAVVAVDGPRGPALRVKRGCVDMARAARVPLIPVGYRCRRARFDKHRWDHWLVPRPFDAIVVHYGAPLFLAEDETLEKALGRVAAALAGASDSRENPTA